MTKMTSDSYKRVRSRTSLSSLLLLLLYTNVLLLLVNTMLGSTRRRGAGSLELTKLPRATSNTLYELVRRLPNYRGSQNGVVRWGRSSRKWMGNGEGNDTTKLSKGEIARFQPGDDDVQMTLLTDETKAVDCKKLLEGDSTEIERSLKVMGERPKFPVQEETYLEWTKNCSRFKRERGYVQVALSAEEEEFPLAFSISTYRDIEQTERLLRAIYQPQNFYCVHADAKSPLLFHRALWSIVECFENVWIASKLHRVKWGDVSVIMPDVTCMEDLLKRHRGRYKYFINLTGQEFPLRTNAELVRIAKVFNGSNDISGSHSRMEMDRVKFIWSHRWSKTYQQTILYNTMKPKQPYGSSNLTFFKGETHGLFSAAMTEYLLESPHGRMFFDWCKNTAHASEHYWNTLNYNEHLRAPGGYTGDLRLADEYSIHPAVRAKNWVNLYEEQWPCHGKVVRGICIFGVKDVAWLAKRPEMFINKFHLTYEHIGYDCLEEFHRNRTMDPSSPSSSFDIRYYENLPTVKYARKYVSTNR